MLIVPHDVLSLARMDLVRVGNSMEPLAGCERN